MISKAGTLRDQLFSLAPCVKVEKFVQAAIEIMMSGYEKGTIENQMLVDWGETVTPK